MEKIVRKRVFYLGIGPEDETMRDAAGRFEGRYYRVLQQSHGWSFPVSRLSEVREAIRIGAEKLLPSSDLMPTDELTDAATQTDVAVQDRATQTDDRPVYHHDIDPGLSRWVHERYPRK